MIYRDAPLLKQPNFSFIEKLFISGKLYNIVLMHAILILKKILLVFGISVGIIGAAALVIFMIYLIFTYLEYVIVSIALIGLLLLVMVASTRCLKSLKREISNNNEKISYNINLKLKNAEQPKF